LHLVFILCPKNTFFESVWDSPSFCSKESTFTCDFLHRLWLSGTLFFSPAWPIQLALCHLALMGLVRLGFAYLGFTCSVYDALKHNTTKHFIPDMLGLDVCTIYLWFSHENCPGTIYLIRVENENVLQSSSFGLFPV